MSTATTAQASVSTAVDTGRSARPADYEERGEHSAESVLSLTPGAGPESTEDYMAPQRPARPDRPVRFADPARNAAYWARIDRIVDAAPPFTDEQRAAIRAAFHQPAARAAA